MDQNHLFEKMQIQAENMKISENISIAKHHRIKPFFFFFFFFLIIEMQIEVFRIQKIHIRHHIILTLKHRPNAMEIYHKSQTQGFRNCQKAFLWVLYIPILGKLCLPPTCLLNSRSFIPAFAAAVAPPDLKLWTHWYIKYPPLKALMPLR